MLHQFLNSKFQQFLHHLKLFRSQIILIRYRTALGSLGSQVYVEPGFKIYANPGNVYMGSNVSLVDTLINAGATKGKVIIEDHVIFGHGCKILSRGHDITKTGFNRHHTFTEKPIHIKQGAWIASGSIIIGGVTIGPHAVIGAGSVVTKDIPAHTFAAGNPARAIKKST